MVCDAALGSSKETNMSLKLGCGAWMTILIRIYPPVYEEMMRLFKAGVCRLSSEVQR